MSLRALIGSQRRAQTSTQIANGILQRKCDKCRKKKRALQRSAFGPAPEIAPPVVHEVLSSPGQQLDLETRAFFEPRFGHDFSRVRVHADARAAESAWAVNALAYTVGQDVVFGFGQYAPKSSAGGRLLAHELMHVVQQGFSHSEGALVIDPSASTEMDANDSISRIGDVTSMPRIFRSISPSMSQALQRKKGQCKGSGDACAASDLCAIPDTGKEGRREQSDRWELEVNIDIERSSWESALRNKEFGHTYVRFWESNGRAYTYGFYPASELPNENRRTVSGCVHHPDTSHYACIDEIVSYSLSHEQYNAGLARAQEICRDGHSYGATYTCTTYAEEIAHSSGKTLPSSRSEPTDVFYQQIPAIDNPNTLIENVRSARGNLSTDEGIRNWVSANDPRTIGQLPTQELIRMINRLMDGWVSDDDVSAIERICRSVTSTAQVARIQRAIIPRVGELMDFGHRRRVRLSLNR